MFTHVEYRITIGTGFFADGSPIPRQVRSHALDIVEQAACDTFGGFTRHDGRGGWVGPDGVTVCEKAMVYRIAVDPVRHDEGEVFHFALRAGRALGQHSVVVARGEQIAFVECQHTEPYGV